MTRFTPSRFMQLCAFLLCLMASHPTSAEELGLADGADQEFADAGVVSDQELSTMRGGYVNINGMLIDFSFLQRITVNDTIVANNIVLTPDLTQAAAAGNVQALVPASVIQNDQNGALVNTLQVLNLVVANAAASQNLHTAMNQASISNANAFH